MSAFIQAPGELSPYADSPVCLICFSDGNDVMVKMTRNGAMPSAIDIISRIPPDQAHWVKTQVMVFGVFRHKVSSYIRV